MKTTSIILRKIFLDNIFGCIWNCTNSQYQCLFTGTIIYFKGWFNNSDNSLLIQTVASCYGSLISIIISYKITVSENKKSHALRITDWRRMSLYVAHAIFQQRQLRLKYHPSRCAISGFCCGVNEIFAVIGFYTAQIGSLLLTLWDWYDVPTMTNKLPVYAA
jgi:hypothetical protein